jgi:hypothetical protein
VAEQAAGGEAAPEEYDGVGFVEGEDAGPIYSNEEAVYITEEVTPGQGLGGGNGDGPFPVTEYVENQVLLTGRLEDINTVVNAVLESEENNVPGLRQKAGAPPIGPVVIEGEGVAAGAEIFTVVHEFDIDEFDAANRVAESVARIRAVAAGLQLPVFVDPNYVASVAAPRLAEEACADPLSGEASPLSGEASPFTSVLTSTSTSAMVPMFWNQWAFGPDGSNQGGIDLVRGGVRRTDVPTGMGKTIYILDTSPFTATGTATFGPPMWFTPALTLNVSHPVVGTLTPATATPCAMSDHGLFVAGLAYAVAPQATLRLIRVLDDHGKGDAGGILTVLFQLTQGTPGGVANSVINMSFGLVSNPPSPGTPSLGQACGALEDELGVDLGGCQNIATVFGAWQGATVSPSTAQSVLDAIEVPMLALLMGALQQQGAVLVAAAGNKSQANHALAAQLPAAFAPSFAGMASVVAGTHQRARAQYSNDGLFMAPGGGDNDSPSCLAAVGTASPPNCWDSPNDFVVSLIWQRTPVQRFTFGYWAGSSFATPILAGMAAVSGLTTCASNSTAPPSVPHRPAICFP